MAVLQFPSSEILRVVLANGVVPRTVTDRRIRGGCDSRGRPWIVPDQAVPRETIALLGRLDVRLLAVEGPTTAELGCWAELLPLQPATPEDGPVLLILPDAMLGSVTGECRRLGVRCEPQLLDGDPNCSAIYCESPPVFLIVRTEDEHSGIEAFYEQSSNVWVRLGWRHPLPDHLGASASRVMVLKPPRSIAVLSVPIRKWTWSEFALARQTRSESHDPGPEIECRVRFRLRPCSRTPRELAWVFPGESALRFREFCFGANERLLRQFEVAHTNQAGQPRVIVRPSPGLRIPPFLPLAADGYYPDPRLPGLFVPSRRSVRPMVRLREMTARMGLNANRFTWVEAGPNGEALPFAVPVEAFHPVPAMIDYRPPAELRLAPEPPLPDPFAFARFATANTVDERSVEPEELPPVRERRPASPSDPVRTDDRPSWFARSVERLLKQFRRTHPTEEPTAEPQKPMRPLPRPTGTSKRVTEKLSSPSALVHGQDRAAKRNQLESRLLSEFPRVGPDRRAAGWTELAEVYAATGNPSDAAICWVNAIWDTPSPPASWLDQWLLAECRAAKQSTPVPSLDRWLGEPGRFGAGRVVAAYAVMGANQPSPPADLMAALPRVMAFLDHHIDDLPARAAWLARLAVTQLCSGDALGLARWRDRILARLREKGPGLDLDEPSFLRFHGTASPDRFQTAREWLVNSHKPILDWVTKLGSGGRLQDVGLDSETHCTKAYAELMLAWGLGCLGERTRSRDWMAKARKALSRPAGQNCDPAVHSILASAFGERIRDVQDGRVPKPGLPPELRDRVDKLTDAHLGRYSVDKIRRHSRILEPVGGGRDYGGLNLRAFRGYDLLGERLQILADRSDPEVLVEDAKPILALCFESPSSANVPRVALTLLDLAPHLDASLVASVLELAEPATSWMEAWFDSLSWGDATTSAKLPGYLARLLHAAFAAATCFNQWPAIRPLVELLVRRSGSDPALRSAVILGAGSLFRSLRKLGYREEAEALLTRIDPGRGQWPADAPTLPPAQFGLAIGWFAVGDEDAGNRILDDARNRLFVARTGEVRDLTELAIAYAEALGFAPPRIALGRLEEIFQLLDRVATTGSTNRYFTLKPLQLTDAVVRSVVTDDFALGPAVRGWLDDDEFLIRRRIHRDMSNVLRDGGME